MDGVRIRDPGTFFFIYPDSCRPILHNLQCAVHFADEQ